MLQEAWGVTARHEVHFAGNGHGRIDLIVGQRQYRSFFRVSRSEFAQMVRRSRTLPVPFGYAGNRRYWLFRNRWFWEDEGLGAEQVRTLVTLHDRRRPPSRAPALR